MPDDFLFRGEVLGIASNGSKDEVSTRLLNLAVLGTQDYPLDRGGDIDSTKRV
jgi:hypothetical protein